MFASEMETYQQQDPPPSENDGGRWSNASFVGTAGRTYTDEEIKAECHRKCIYLGFVVRRLVSIYNGIEPENDRDHY